MSKRREHSQKNLELKIFCSDIQRDPLYTIDFDRDELREYDLDKARRVLQKRYEDCNVSFHRKPDQERNICLHCYRNLKGLDEKYNDDLAKYRMHQSKYNSQDTAVHNRKREELRERQRQRLDFPRGLLEVARELHLKIDKSNS